jgi:hypothetical protein
MSYASALYQQQAHAGTWEDCCHYGCFGGDRPDARDANPVRDRILQSALVARCGTATRSATAARRDRSRNGSMRRDSNDDYVPKGFHVGPGPVKGTNSV